MLTGPMARSLAIAATAGLGISAWRGKISWEWAGCIIGGIVLVFGGASFVDYFALV
ncbi:TrbC/VirB2 family protein [Pseudomonas sp. JG-B]|uniref:TrbC/VirB2 family protein n=1 Tax=Pseudomonas sp. JG-B TaxID=2603214 RepID=UPI001C49B5D6|nr:TrbC/VirB2 family protein [Pseudomonas sp. JG-B]